jgi:hypothetical protein
MLDTRPRCDRCEEKLASRWGRAQARTERGIVWLEVGLCERCAAQTAGPSIQRSALAVESHRLTGGRR